MKNIKGIQIKTYCYNFKIFRDWDIRNFKEKTSGLKVKQNLNESELAPQLELELEAELGIDLVSEVQLN